MKTVKVLAVIALVVLVRTPANAATVGTDTAAPRWVNSAYNATTNGLDCAAIGSGTCTLRITTTTSQAGCASETIAPPGVLQMNTYCSASIAGTITATQSPVGCVLTALSSLLVTFNSGVTSIFNGHFYVGATFKPLSTYPITQYLMTIRDSSPLESPGTGVGTLITSFTISTNGIPNKCADSDYPNRKGTPKAVQNGTPTLTVAVG